MVWPLLLLKSGHQSVKFHWLCIFHWQSWKSCSCSFRITFLGKFWKDWAEIQLGYEDITWWSDARVFELRILMVFASLKRTGPLAGGRLLLLCLLQSWHFVLTFIERIYVQIRILYFEVNCSCHNVHLYLFYSNISCL